jgi:endonuclease/exonuclease/phosphatase family metal-dependent hydrolase
MASANEGPQWARCCGGSQALGAALRRRVIAATLRSAAPDVCCVQESLFESADAEGIDGIDGGECYRRVRHIAHPHVGVTSTYVNTRTCAVVDETCVAAPDEVCPSFPIVTVRLLPAAQQSSTSAPPESSSSSSTVSHAVVCSVHLAPFAQNHRWRREQIARVAAAVLAAAARQRLDPQHTLLIIAGDFNMPSNEFPPFACVDAWYDFAFGSQSPPAAAFTPAVLESWWTFGGDNDFNCESFQALLLKRAQRRGSLAHRYDRVIALTPAHSGAAGARRARADTEEACDASRVRVAHAQRLLDGRIVMRGEATTTQQPAQPAGRYASDHFGVLVDFALA